MTIPVDTIIKTIPTVFVSGPVRGKDSWVVECNIRRAEELALEVWKKGAAAICPHTNTRFFNGHGDDDNWLYGYLSVLRCCQAVIFTPDWEKSEGARAERELAKKLGLPMFDSITDLEKWINNYKNKVINEYQST